MGNLCVKDIICLQLKITNEKLVPSTPLSSHVIKFVHYLFKRRIDNGIGISISAENIRAIFESDLSSKVHPVKEYFQSQLAQTLKSANPEKRNEYLTKWLMRGAANALKDICYQNQLV